MGKKMASGFLKGIAKGAILALCGWFIVSIAEINGGNAGHNPHYSKYNLFVMVADYPDTM